jgi:hypothetical protein
VDSQVLLENGECGEMNLKFGAGAGGGHFKLLLL